jgi:hypothetical protein
MLATMLATASLKGQKTARTLAVAAGDGWNHNPRVGGSSPSSGIRFCRGFFVQSRSRLGQTEISRCGSVSYECLRTSTAAGGADAHVHTHVHIFRLP